MDDVVYFMLWINFNYLQQEGDGYFVLEVFRVEIFYGVCLFVVVYFMEYVVQFQGLEFVIQVCDFGVVGC